MAGFTPPPYPYDRLAPLQEAAKAVPGGIVDLSVGTPCDPPPAFLAEAMADASAAQSYPPSVGTAAYRAAAADWVERRFGASIGPALVAACMGTKELVAGVPHWLRLRSPHLDTVLYPEISYPTYAMGATLAGCRAIPVPVDDDWRIRLDAISDDDAARSLCLWVNTPGNPAGGLEYFQTMIWPEYIKASPTGMALDPMRSCTRAGQCHNEAGGNPPNFTTMPPNFAANYRQAQGYLNCGDPMMSDMLTKPLTGTNPHSGGDLIPANDPSIQIFLGWFEEP